MTPPDRIPEIFENQTQNLSVRRTCNDSIELWFDQTLCETVEG